MREILFKGKCIKTSVWLFGSLVIRNSNIGLKYAIHNSQGSFIGYVLKDTIGQYTGLKDKNGVKIFEGDYLHMPGYHCEVVFTDGGFLTVYKHPEDGEILPILDLDLSYMEVIGNIHDNV